MWGGWGENAALGVALPEGEAGEAGDEVSSRSERAWQIDLCTNSL